MSIDMKEVMQKAAALFAEYKEGDIFQWRMDANDTWNDIAHWKYVTDYLNDGQEVQIKPKPVRRLRPVGDILDEAIKRNCIKYAGDDVQIVDAGCWHLADLISDGEAENGPDWFYTTETPTPPVDRIGEMAQAAAQRIATISAIHDLEHREHIERLIREECASRGIS